MAKVTVLGPTIAVETDLLSAQVRTEGYVSGVFRDSFLDKATGARDTSFGLDIADFLLEPAWDEPDTEPEHLYHGHDALHGDLPRRYVEGPQICTQAGKLDFEVIEGKHFVAIRQWYAWQWATYGRRPGSHWEQTLIFADGLRYFLCADRITSANDVDALIFRLDMPGHLRHTAGDSFEQIYLSYHGCISPSEFPEDFPPDGKFLYQRDDATIPPTMIRARQVTLADGSAGPWLAGITLDPATVFDAWCHQRGYVCFIEEIGGWAVKAGESFGAAHAVGWFEDIAQMQAVAAMYQGARAIDVHAGGWRLRED
ncbi:MAG: hypothetical protein AB7Y46_12085 [Armatimonadota bacterium]